MKTVLVTGAAGMIGSNLCKYLLELGEYRVVGVDNFSGGYKSILHELSGKYPNFSYTAHDCCDQGFEGMFRLTSPDYVFALHAYAAENLSPFIRKFNYQNNVVSMANIVNCCIKYGVQRLVFTSSIAVYGHQESPFVEYMKPEPADPYGVGKYTTEMDIQIASKQHGLEYCIVRPYNVYGLGQNINDRFRNVLGIWMKQFLTGQPMLIFGDGEQVRAFTYVGDIMQPMLNAAIKKDAANTIINLGASFPYTVNEANEVLRSVIGQGAEVVYEAKRHEAVEAFCDNSKAKSILGYRDETTLEQGLSAMWEWVNLNSVHEWEQKTPPSLEVSKGLYSAWAK